MTSKDLASRIRDIPDFPKPGVTFKDITPLLADAAAFARAVDALCDSFAPLRVDKVLGIEADKFASEDKMMGHLTNLIRDCKAILAPLALLERSSMRSESMSDTFSATTSETRSPAP